MEGRRGKCQTRTIVWHADGAGPNGLRKARLAQPCALGRLPKRHEVGKSRAQRHRVFADRSATRNMEVRTVK